MSGDALLEHPAAWADLLTVLAHCVREPDDELVDAVQTGEVSDALADASRRIGLDITFEYGLAPPPVPSVGELTESYLGLFEGMRTPFAPLAESPYKPWYGGRSGLMHGPPADDMTRRYAAIGATFSDDYPPDNAALLLEYAALLLESGNVDAFVGFVESHFDWFSALRVATAGAAASAPFHRWAVALLDEVTSILRVELGLRPVESDATRVMAARVTDVDASTSRV